MVMAVNQFYEVVYFTKSGTQMGINVCHYKCTNSVGADTTELEAIQALSARVGPKYRACMSVQAEYRGASIRLKTVPPPQAILDDSGHGAGTTGDENLPEQVSGIITKRTALAGKGFRGRFYIAFPSDTLDGVLVPSVPTTTALGLFADLGHALFDTLDIVNGVGGTCTLVAALYHRETNTFDLMTGFQPRQLWATQRRRGSYGKMNAATPI